jgi:serine/threonine protein phosphatase PrpC
MKYKYFYFYEKGLNENDHPKEDFAVTNGKSFVVTDGVTIRYSNLDTPYPDPSPSAEVAKIVAEKTLKEISQGKTINTAIKNAHKEVGKSQLSSTHYKNREKNEYNFGSTQIAVLTLEQYIFSYSYLADCEIEVFSKNNLARLSFKDEVEETNSYLNKNLSKLQQGSESAGYIWRKRLRNNKIIVDDKELGYGSIDGVGDFLPFLRSGREKIKPGDLIIICTDGIKPAIRENTFIKKINNSKFDSELTKWCKQFMRKNNLNSEKTAYFIKIL